MTRLAFTKFRQSTGAQRKEYFESVGWSSGEWAGRTNPCVSFTKNGFQVVVDTEESELDATYIRLRKTYTDWIDIEINPALSLFEVHLAVFALLDNPLFYQEEMQR